MCWSYDSPVEFISAIVVLSIIAAIMDAPGIFKVYSNTCMSEYFCPDWDDRCSVIGTEESLTLTLYEDKSSLHRVISAWWCKLSL